MKRILSLTLALFMVLPLLFSCSPEKKEKLPEKQRLENVYLTTEYDLPENVNSAEVIFSGDNVFLFGRREVKGVDENGFDTYDYHSAVFKTDSEFSSFEELVVIKDENNWSENDTSVSGSYANGIYPCADGSFLVLFNSWYEDWSDPEEYIYENSWELKRYDAQGASISETKLVFSDNSDEYVYIADIEPLSDGRYIILTDMKLYVMNFEGNVEKECDAFENAQSISLLDDGRLIITYYDENWNVCWGEFSVEANSVKKYAGFENSNGGYPIITPDGRVFSRNTTELVEYELETGKELGVEINWFNSDINPNYVHSLTYHNSHFYNVDSSDWENPSLMKLTPCDDVIEKYVIDLATLDLEYTLADSIIEFNRSHAEHRIVVNTYSEYTEEGNVGIEKLDERIVQGDIPDIICLDNLDYKKYSSKGILTDLTPFIDGEGGVSREDFLPNILDFGTDNGKLYSLITSFGVESVIAKTSVVGDRTALSWSELEAILSRYPEAVAFSNMEREELLKNILSASLYDFVDYTTGNTSFESEQFKALLKFCSGYPEEINWDTYYEDYDYEAELQGYRNNKILLQHTSAYSPWDVIYLLKENNFGEKVSLIGYPTESASGSVLVPWGEWGIAESSGFKAEAFEFISSLFSEDAYEERYRFPTVKGAFDEAFEDIIIDETEDEQDSVEENVVVEDSSIMVPDIGYEVAYGVTHQEAEEFKNFVKGVTKRRAPRDSELINIIVEESASYFNEEKSLDETCRIIQSRAFIYVSENM